jgi:hypothetical protein
VTPFAHKIFPELHYISQEKHMVVFHSEKLKILPYFESVDIVAGVFHYE